MRVFTVSDIHIDFSCNKKWLLSLSKQEYANDILILGGDISHDLSLIELAFRTLTSCFKDVFYIPGNHDLWSERGRETSWQRFETLNQISDSYNIHRHSHEYEQFIVVPILCWYDYSFGSVSERLKRQWGDFFRCNWEEMNDAQVNKRFLKQNHFVANTNKRIISFSHFLPRMDVLPTIARLNKLLAPVLGTKDLEKLIRKWPSSIHIYGHSHINVYTWRKGILYINNAFGYPRETDITAKKLLDITYDVFTKTP